MTSRLSHRRAWALTLVGAILVLHAAMMYGETIPDRDAALLHTLLPLEVRIGAWLTTGTLAVSLAWTRWQWVAAAAAILMPIERAISHTWAWLMYLVPGGPSGQGGSWALALQWGAWSALIMCIARWAEVPREVQHNE